MSRTQPSRPPQRRLLAAGALCLVALAACSSPGQTRTELAGGTATTVDPAATAPDPAATGSTATEPEAPATADVVGTRTLAAVPVQREARFSEGLTVKVTSVTEAEVTAVHPGEVSGPGMLVALTFTNGSPDPVDLDGVRVNASRPDGTPASGLEGPPYAAPTGVLEVGESGTATFVYSIPKGTARSMTLEITSVSSTDTVIVDV
ncbi:hypothetical protein [Kineococcus sp. SYSU DK002]|uniref:hypothetical protein n=1 Tax=Kineococcus sp. SYSU DK002 TaxID=3383123 RepID=UPI003D7E8EA8